MNPDTFEDHIPGPKIVIPEKTYTEEYFGNFIVDTTPTASEFFPSLRDETIS